VYQFSSANTAAIVHEPDVAGASPLSITLPPYSITLLVMNPAQTGPPLVWYPSTSADGIGSTVANVHASVRPQGTVTGCHFEYGPTAAYGSTAPCATPLPSGVAAQPVQAAISGLMPDTTYHFRLDVTNAAGTTSGSDQTFFTAFALSRGWNLIGLPSDAVYTAAILSGEIGPTARAVGVCSNGRFNVYVPGYGADIALASYQGVFVLTSAATTWLPTGNPVQAAPAAPIHLSTGWNLLTEPYPSVHSAQDIADQIGPSGCADASSTTACVLQSLATMTNGSYSVYSPTSPTNLTVRTGDGFFALLKTTVDWTP
jgi:hypothetical protein